jgi:hypothetical protein
MGSVRSTCLSCKTETRVCCRVVCARACVWVKVGGSALFYAWAQDQAAGFSGHEFAAQDVLVPFHLRAPAPLAVAAVDAEASPGELSADLTAPPRMAKRRLSPVPIDTPGSHSHDSIVSGSEAFAEASAAGGLAQYDSAKGSLVFQRCVVLT